MHTYKKRTELKAQTGGDDFGKDLYAKAAEDIFDKANADLKKEAEKLAEEKGWELAEFKHVPDVLVFIATYKTPEGADEEQTFSCPITAEGDLKAAMKNLLCNKIKPNRFRRR